MGDDSDQRETLRNPFTGQTIRFVSESDEVLVMESTYRAGSFPAPLHLHPSQEERFHGISGAVRVNDFGRERALRAGEELVIEAGTPHEMGGHPDEDGTIRWEVRPPLRTREFFEGLFASLNAAAAQQEDPEAPAAPFEVDEYRDVFRLADEADTQSEGPSGGR